MGIVLPDFLSQTLAADKNLQAAVLGTTADFDPWLKDSKLPFFTDYTDHGADHLSKVLATAVALLTKDACQQFTPGDAAVLVIATLLHDSAMHLSEAGFRELVEGSAKSRRIGEFDSRVWPDLWDEFLFAAKRWDDRKLVEVFGELPDGLPRCGVRDPFDHYNNLADGDRKLVGEFIRYFHPRMAHEFALFGVPGPTAEPIKVDKRLQQDLCDIAGLVARSHGVPVRRCVDYLAQKYHRREYQGVHAVYLMTLLRVADYLQIDASRAPAIAFRYKHIPSPVSVLEWRTHNAIKNITPTHDDPESIQIQANPEDVRTFLRLRDWLNGIQSELDSSWAVLGEVYGSQRALSVLGLSIRRVRSNLLDDLDTFMRSARFVTDRVRFDVARAELLKLLIRPLYADRPEIGVRELIQNAVDAVLELRELQRHHPSLASVPLADQEADVVVWLDDADESGHAWLSVTDRGIGMTEDVIKDYFLKAGASFRQSDAWKLEFEDDVEGEGHQPKSQVLRSGRFGVGALAAFLLGDEIEVTTRHANSPAGLSFKTRLDTDAIEVSRVEGVPVGTSIRVRVNQRTVQQLSRPGWRVEIPPNSDWYYFDSPSVVRLRGKARERLETKYRIDLPTPEHATNWRKLPANLPYEVYWSYAEAPALTCNGLFVNNSQTLLRFEDDLAKQADYTLNRPKISVRDHDAQFPLTLQRTQLSVPDYPFDEALANEIIRDVFGWLLATTPTSNDLRMLDNMSWHPGLWPESYSGPFLCACDAGFSLVRAELFRAIPIKHLVLVSSPGRSELLPQSLTCDAALYYNDLQHIGRVTMSEKGSRLVWGEGWNSPGLRLQGVRILKKKGSAESPVNSDLTLEVEQERGSWQVICSALS